MVSGAELDYLLASRSIAPFVDIKANWDVPWKPHAGLVVTIDKAAPRLDRRRSNMRSGVTTPARAKTRTWMVPCIGGQAFACNP